MSLNEGLNITDILMAKYSPLSQLSKKYLNQLIKCSKVMTFTKGETLFKKQHELPFTYYLLKGRVRARISLLNNELLDAKSERCLSPINSSIPNGVSVKSLEPGYLLLVDTLFMDRALGWTEAELEKENVKKEKNHRVKATETPGTATDDTFDPEYFDWITSLLEFPLFFNLPSSNIEKIFEKFEKFEVDEEQVIIEEGGEGEYFYLLVNGSARVVIGGREDKPIRLSKGSYFGEEALISDSVCSASVIMNEKGVLARLDKRSYQSLLQDSLVRKVNGAEYRAKRNTNPEDVVLLDIRSEGEFEYSPIPNCLHIELNELRQRLTGLNKSKIYYLTEEGGQRSEIAAHILSQNNIQVFVISHN